MRRTSLDSDSRGVRVHLCNLDLASYEVWNGIKWSRMIMWQIVLISLVEVVIWISLEYAYFIIFDSFDLVHSLVVGHFSVDISGRIFEMVGKLFCSSVSQTKSTSRRIASAMTSTLALTHWTSLSSPLSCRSYGTRGALWHQLMWRRCRPYIINGWKSSKASSRQLRLERTSQNGCYVPRSKAFKGSYI